MPNLLAHHAFTEISDDSNLESKEQQPLNALVQLDLRRKNTSHTREKDTDKHERNDEIERKVDTLTFVSPRPENTQNQQHLEEIQWQHAVYTRRSSREYFTFSHVSTTTVMKAFPASLSIPCIRHMDGIYKQNLDTFRSATTLILVTGNWAVHLSLEAFTDNNYSIDRLPLKKYDHLCRMGLVDNAECSELNKEYRALKYHCTMANYEAGTDHAWKLQNVIPMLSDLVILPRILDERRLKPVFCSFLRATRKAVKDSLIVAGNQRLKEEQAFKQR
jgi:hypothetical protein